MEDNTYTYSDIFPFLRTKEEVIHFTSQIDVMLASLFKIHPEGESLQLTAIFSPQFAHGITNVLSKNKINLNNRSDLKFFFLHLKDALRKLKILKITIAVHPTTELVTTIANYTKQTFGTEVILDITVNAGLTGGALIMYDGAYLDMTVAKRVQTYMDKHREDIYKLFHPNSK